MKQLFRIIFLLLTFSAQLIAQKADSIIFVPDRPGAATPPDILSFERFQFEAGVQTENYNQGTALNENYLLPSVLFRIGIIKNAEIRLTTDYAHMVSTDSGVISKLSGLNPITLGTKFKVFRQRGLIPNFSVLVNLTLPFYGKEEFKPDNLGSSMNLLMSNLIGNNLNICYNYGISWDGNGSPASHFYALGLGLGLSKKISLFAETYGYSGRYSRANIYYDGGLAFLLNDHMQIDVSGGGQYDSNNNYIFINAGFAWQFPGKKLKF